MKRLTTENRKKNILKEILRRAGLIIIGILLGVNIYLANASGFLGNPLPMPFGYGMATVMSGSMEPTFSVGTLLFVKETEDVAPEDIVVYQSGNALIVHRVTAVDGNTITTQGDANNAADQPFDRSQIKGVVIGWVPFLGNVAIWAKTPTGIIVLLLLAFFLIEASFRKKKASDEEQLEAIKTEIRRLQAEKEQDKDTKH